MRMIRVALILLLTGGPLAAATVPDAGVEGEGPGGGAIILRPPGTGTGADAGPAPAPLPDGGAPAGGAAAALLAAPPGQGADQAIGGGSDPVWADFAEAFVAEADALTAAITDPGSAAGAPVPPDAGDDPGPVAAVPLPAGGWMLLAGLGALALLRRRGPARA